MAGHPIRSLVQRLVPARGHRLRQQLCGLLDLLADLSGLGPWDRDEPVQVRVSEVQRQPALAARSAGTVGGPALAEQELRQPERQPLLTYSLGTSDQNDLGQPTRFQ